MLLSICIVNLNAKKYLSRCLKSISWGLETQDYEIIIVDNNSSDKSCSYIKNLQNKKIILIQNSYNSGYTIAINKALEKSKGENILILNPDSILEQKSIDTLLKFLKYNENAGIVGPKVINELGLFQASCRRGIATPLAVFSYFLGFAKLFKKNRLFTGYQLNHLDEDYISQVDGVSGSCMIIKREVVNKIGHFDERFFAYQEDSDFCLRAKKEGWSIYYNPEAKIMHIGGVGGANSVPMKAIFEWHRSYYRYYFKHFSKSHSILFNFLYIIIMGLKLIFSETLFILKR
jgi:GT2 family glycosyltransferase